MLSSRPYAYHLLGFILCLSLLTVALPFVRATPTAQATVNSQDQPATTVQIEEQDPGLTPLPLPDTAENTLIRITENGSDPSELASFGPATITWLNTTTFTQTLTSGVSPSIIKGHQTSSGTPMSMASRNRGTWLRLPTLTPQVRNADWLHSANAPLRPLAIIGWRKRCSPSRYPAIKPIIGNHRFKPLFSTG
jgi:hypothetical protein